MKYLLLLLLPTFFFSQNTINIELKSSMTDPYKKTKILTVKDIREDKEIGSVKAKGENYTYTFQEDLKKLVEDQFHKTNKTENGSNEIVVLVEKIKVYDNTENSTLSDLDIKISTFYKRNNYYSFIDRVEGVFPNKIEGRLTAARSFAEKISSIIESLIIGSYGKVGIPYSLNEENLLKYEDLITSSYLLNKNQDKISGVYLDFNSFLKQEPSDYTYKVNKKGDISSVKDGDFGVPKSYVYAIIDDNKIYKSTLVGYKLIKKDDKGMYIDTSYNRLFKKNENTSGAMVGAMTGGIVGALIGGMIDASDPTPISVYGDLVTEKVYIDPINFGYTVKSK